MNGDGTVAPVIIKRKKVVAGGGGHHSGAWKVAYADFVTAMMAFFMLMWLLNATTETQRAGIADYFTPTVSISRISGGGDGLFGGESVVAENTLPREGTGASALNPTEADRARGFYDQGKDEAVTAEDEVFREVEEKLTGRGGESIVADERLQHIVTRVTDEGLVVELFETERGRLFDGAQPTPLLASLAREVSEAARMVRNDIAIGAHTAAFPVVVAEDPVWDVSGARARAFQGLLLQTGTDERRFSRVTAHADREPVEPNRMAVRNNRIEIVFLRK
ncbi:flagellar motor protein MotB [Citreimonas salinaria]|uniref:Chemotaxis protein MotB n=1 Tax=Citreimonas salinaria TaxID=321339 RepID=A0A1H3FDZ7_9RHOB|nr:flagellar motor protein MotB [Citreimonas salinaria]SDX89140.1 chemotaxis protein MotB [Citreimonas salinaria]